jgi:benzodiazapine receptor
MNKDLLRQIINVLTVILTLTVNGLANALPINGLNTGQISDMFQVYFVPAGYVFSIWGLIYLALIAFAVYQALPSQRENPRLRRIGYLFALSCLANSAWIFFWHYLLFPLTLVMMLALLACLIIIYIRVDVNQKNVSTLEKWTVDIPFSLYLGWITVATIANVTDVLEALGWTGWGISPETWAISMLVASVLIAGFIAFTRGDVAYLLVLVWAFIGIAVKQSDTTVVANSAWGAATLVTLLMLAGVTYRRRQI